MHTDFSRRSVGLDGVLAAEAVAWERHPAIGDRAAVVRALQHRRRDPDPGLVVPAEMRPYVVVGPLIEPAPDSAASTNRPVPRRLFRSWVLCRGLSAL
jgi:hypothetical protein